MGSFQLIGATATQEAELIRVLGAAGWRVRRKMRIKALAARDSAKPWDTVEQVDEDL